MYFQKHVNTSILFMHESYLPRNVINLPIFYDQLLFMHLYTVKLFFLLASRPKIFLLGITGFKKCFIGLRKFSALKNSCILKNCFQKGSKTN